MYVKVQYAPSTGEISSVELILGSVTTPSQSGILYAPMSSIPAQNLGDFVSNPQHYQISNNQITLRSGMTQTGERTLTSVNMDAPMALLRVNTVGSFATL